MISILKRVRLNEQIRAKEIRVIGTEGEQVGILPPGKALEMARMAGLDLVEVAPAANPPVCRIMDYSKYKYDQERKQRQARKRQRTIHIKEIRVRPKIEEHDYQVKLSHLVRFLNRKDKVKVSLMFRGREMVHPEMGRRVLERFLQDVSGLAEVEKEPTREGRFMTMVVAPK